MCEANAYLVNKNGKRELYMESVDKVVPQDEGLLLENIFGVRKQIKARIVGLELVEHKILLEKEH